MKSTMHIQVSDQDLDHKGHVGYKTYLDWFEKAHDNFLHNKGLGSISKTEEEFGLLQVVKTLETHYNGSLFKGDRIIIQTTVDSVGTTSLTYSHIVHKGKSITATAKYVIVLVRDGQKVAIPDQMKTKLLMSNP